MTGWKLAVVIASLIGLIGTIAPGIPGALLIFGAALGYGWLTDFAQLGAGPLVTLAILALVAEAGDFLLGAAGARVAGGSRRAMAGAGIGTLVGVVILGPWGLIVGPIAGAFIFEMSHGRGLLLAGRVGAAAGVGAIIGSLFKFLVAMVMIVLLWRNLFLT